MRYRSAVAILLALPFLASAGARAQEITLPGLGGGRLTEGELGEGTRIIVFWTSWAPRGRDVVQRVNALVERWEGRARILTVNFQEDEAAVRAFLSDKPKLRAEVYLDKDGGLSKKYRVNSAPWLLILKDGRTSFNERFPADPGPVIDQILG